MQTTRQKPILEARGIVKVLGAPGTEFTVLKGVDVELFPGELTLLMGPSGSGKTTLLSILGCILTPTAGELEINGERAHGLVDHVPLEARERSLQRTHEDVLSVLTARQLSRDATLVVERQG